MDKFILNYHENFKNLFKCIEGDYNGIKNYSDTIKECVQLIYTTQLLNHKIIMVGNGGSAGITSHMAVDFWKNGKIRATAFNDASLLTCLSNDLGYSEVFSKPIETFADQGDVVFCISSSGNSINIINAAKQAKKSGCKLVTFSGFDQNNSLRVLGDVNFYVPSYSYGYVEIIHNFIIHAILDAKLYNIDKIDVFNKNKAL